MNLFERLKNKKEKIAVVGLGYVGIPIAVAFAKHTDVIGFDINETKVNKYKNGIDPTNEVGDEVIQGTTIEFTSNPSDLKYAKFHIVAVPTPINHNHTPDLKPLEKVSKMIGQHLTKGSVVVYESTVFPGVTEEVCVPILEDESGLNPGVDFKVGYSPERINPGDTINTIETIVKIVSGMDEETLETVAKVYELIVRAGVHRAPSIKVAESAKVIENAQRDVNIAFMNELSMIFNKLNIDTREVLEAAGTKWNFLKFTPGLVGGHCIGVDPYYLTYKAEEEGYHSKIILAGRRINDDMGSYIAENIIKQLINIDVSIKNARVGILGFTFKENTPDTRNTRVIDIINELNEFSIDPIIYDPVANSDEVFNEYGIHLNSKEELRDLDVLVVAVSHNEYKNISIEEIDNLFTKTKNNKKIIIDIKAIFDKNQMEELDYQYWRL